MEDRELDAIRPAPENSDLYRPVSLDDPEIRKLADSIKQKGLLEPLKVSIDNYIINGHRRHAACQLLGWEVVRCEIVPILRRDPVFIELLRENNRQRVKTPEEAIREAIVDHKPRNAYARLKARRAKQTAVSGDRIEIKGEKVRHGISEGKQQMLDRIIEIVQKQKAYWPLSDRSIHYDMLNNPPLRHSKKPDSRYVNDANSYHDLCDMLTRARLLGLVPFAAIADPTRTVQTWPFLFSGVQQYVAKQLEDFLDTYWRDRMQSQPNHIEIVAEKNTVEGSVKRVALRYSIPYTIGRGYCSITPRYEMSERFKASRKKHLVVLVLHDFDPDGLEIAHSFAKSLRDDFGIEDIVPKSVCLNWEQVQRRQLEQTFDLTETKKSQPKFREHIKRFGEHFHELEALPSAERSKLLGEAIRSVIDVKAYNAEIRAEEKDEETLQAYRDSVLDIMRKTLK
jgi:hypothetical protein